jgi:hypothetical protein
MQMEMVFEIVESQFEFTGGDVLEKGDADKLEVTAKCNVGIGSIILLPIAVEDPVKRAGSVYEPRIYVLQCPNLEANKFTKEDGGVSIMFVSNKCRRHRRPASTQSFAVCFCFFFCLFVRCVMFTTRLQRTRTTMSTFADAIIHSAINTLVLTLHNRLLTQRSDEQFRQNPR